MHKNANADLTRLPRSAGVRPGGGRRGAAAGPTLPLPDHATVVVVGGGPAGSFFAIRLLRRARRTGRSVNVIILEKKSEICFYGPVPFSSWEGCNYCAGGVSPRLIDSLKAEGITIPEEVIESRPTEIVVHGDWKSILLWVPEGREMLSVFRGSRPRQRAGRYENFDTWLLNLACSEGARVITADVDGVSYSASGRPVVSYRAATTGPAPAAGAPTAAARPDGLAGDADPSDPARTDIPAGPAYANNPSAAAIEADFAVFATGVNRSPGMDLKDDPILAALQKMIPQLRPPKVRKAVIAEMRDAGNGLHVLEGELHFAQYGSKDLHIEMASVMPKREWITTVLLGKSIDRAEPMDSLQLVERFLDLPNIRRLVPHKAKLYARCCCNPNMTVGAAKNPLGARVALTGDLAVARLYKDGLYSAYTTSSALVDCILDRGIDKDSLARHYGTAVRALHADNRYGRVIFWLSHLVLSHPASSRVLYRAVITERMYTPRQRHRLAPVLWQVASGDDTYRRALVRMLHPASLWLLFAGGLLSTIRDVITERVFGLDWTGIPRYITGVPLERMEPTRNALFALQGMEPPSRPPQMEEMFTIRIRAGKDAVFRQLGAFGDPSRKYLQPRFLRITRLQGEPNKVGTVIRYHVPLIRLSFSVMLEKAEPGRYQLYRIVEGMGEGGILAFILDELRSGVNLLTIYVGFDFPKGRGLGRIGWAIGRRIFPEFAHNVVWNHSLCQIRYLAEMDEG